MIIFFHLDCSIAGKPNTLWPARPKKQTSVAGIDMNKQGRVDTWCRPGYVPVRCPKIMENIELVLVFGTGVSTNLSSYIGHFKKDLPIFGTPCPSDLLAPATLHTQHTAHIKLYFCKFYNFREHKTILKSYNYR